MHILVTQKIVCEECVDSISETKFKYNRVSSPFELWCDLSLYTKAFDVKGAVDD